MSIYHSDKISREELKEFKTEVINWLTLNFPKWKDKYKLKAFRCYSGNCRLYDGSYNDFPNMRNSFRRGEPNYNDKGEIIGWHGTSGVHTTKTINYISINKDEFDKIQKSWQE